MRPLQLRTRAARALEQWNNERAEAGLPRVTLAEPDQHRAYALVRFRQKKGSLKPEPCEACGSVTNIHGHHDDYLSPLDLRWFCDACHSTLHRTGVISRYGCNKPGVERTYEPVSEDGWLEEALRVLSPHHRHLMELIVLRGVPMRGRAAALGVSKQCVSQTELQAEARLREWAEGRGLAPLRAPAGRIAPALAAESEAA